MTNMILERKNVGNIAKQPALHHSLKGKTIAKLDTRKAHLF